MHTVCGLLLHDSLAVTTDGLPLGLSAAKFWTRKKFKGTNALKKKICPTRVPIEKIARLGGYLDRKNDPPPGNMGLWRGMTRLTDIHIGATIRAKLMGCLIVV